MGESVGVHEINGDANISHLEFRVGLSVALVSMSFLITNGSVYPAFALVAPYSRDAATLLAIVFLIALVGLVRRYPHLLVPRVFGSVALMGALLYPILGYWGTSHEIKVLVYASALLDTAAEAWVFMVAFVSFCQVEGTKRAHVALVSCMAAYLGQIFPPHLPASVGMIINAVMFVSILGVTRSLVAPIFELVRTNEPQVEMAIVEPRSFLPVWHLVFVCVVVFSIAQGWGTVLPGPFNDAPPLPIAFIPVFIALVLFVIREKKPDLDELFSLCALCIVGGMFLQGQDRLLSPVGWSLSLTLMDAGALCFNVILFMLAAAISDRNRLVTVSTCALIVALNWVGVGIGASSGNGARYFFGLSEAGLLWVSFLSAMGFIAFCFLVLNRMSFKQLIGNIQAVKVNTATVQNPERQNDTKDTVAQVGTAYNLTPREVEVLELLAAGRTVGIIRERLVISLNTARFHTKNVYAKLGVHSQQELISLVEHFDSSRG